MIQPRRHLRSDVTAEVQDRLLSGLLPVGRINESDLAAELGISRTPLREALLVMEQRGLIESAMGRGFLVRGLSLSEAEELYPLLSVLEAMAVRTAGPALAARVPQLRELLDGMRREHDPEQLAALGQQWAACLVEACPNRKLAAILADLHRLSTRYERRNLANLDLRLGSDLGPALAKHQAFVDALADADYDRAAELIAATCQDCLAMLRRNLSSPPAPPR